MLYIFIAIAVLAIYIVILTVSIVRDGKYAKKRDVILFIIVMIAIMILSYYAGKELYYIIK